MNEKHKRFADEYLIDLNATQAAIRAGYSAKTANEQGAQLLAKLSIQKFIQERIKEREKRTEITQDMVLQRWWTIANADPNELIYHRRVCCRYCFGAGHAYQWIDDAEYEKSVSLAETTEGMTAPSDDGGYGFDRTIRPHPKCPNCHGEGYGEIKATDTRDVSPQARMLYAGVKQTQGGFEVKMRDQDKALENVARHLGMFKDKGDAPVTTNNVNISGLSLEELRKLAKSKPTAT